MRLLSVILMVGGIEFTVITKETYEDLCGILEAIHGAAWDSKVDVDYYNALALIVNRYEEESEQTEKI